MPNHLNTVFRALADPSRRMIVERLSRGDTSVGELAEPLEMTLPSVMQHLRVLEASGIIRSRKTGRVRMCRLNAAVLDDAERWFAERRALWNDRLDRLGDHLEGEQR